MDRYGSGPCGLKVAALAAVAILSVSVSGPAAALPGLGSRHGLVSSTGVYDAAFRGRGGRGRHELEAGQRYSLGARVRDRHRRERGHDKADNKHQDDDKPDKPRRPKKDRNADKTPARDRNRDHAHRPHKIACMGGRVRDGACHCRGGAPAQRVGVMPRFVCAPGIAWHRRPVLGLAAAAGGAGGVAAVTPPANGGTRGGLPPLAAASAEPEAHADEVLFWLDNDLPESTEARIAGRLKLQILSRTRSKLIGRRFVHARIRDGRAVADIVAALKNERQISSPQPNYIYRQQEGAQPPPTGGLQYALERIDWAAARRSASGRGAVVALIDTGLDRGHPDLAGADIREIDPLPKTDGGDTAHATALAGIIVGRGATTGIAPDARVLALRAFGGQTGATGSTTSVLKALELAVAEGARVINMSFAGPRDASIEKAVSAAAQLDIIMIAAAGNAGHRAPPAFPAAYPEVIAVTATDALDRLYADANTGAYVAIAAPGVDVLVPVPQGAYDLKSGTSYAAAHVSAVVALMLELNPRLSPNAARRRLAAGAADLGAPGPDDEFGAGRVNAALSLSDTMTSSR